MLNALRGLTQFIGWRGSWAGVGASAFRPKPSKKTGKSDWMWLFSSARFALIWGVQMSIKTFIAATVTAMALLAAPAYAQDAPAKKAPSEKQLAQRAKMKNCNAEAKSQSLKGDDRKAFMKTCLSGGTPDAAGSTAAMPAPSGDQKAKMKACNVEAKDKALKGDDRKAFMKTCLTAG